MARRWHHRDRIDERAKPAAIASFERQRKPQAKRGAEHGNAEADFEARGERIEIAGTKAFEPAHAETIGQDRKFVLAQLFAVPATGSLDEVFARRRPGKVLLPGLLAVVAVGVYLLA